MDDWRTPTTYLKRFGDAITLLCGGIRPSDQAILDWFDESKDSFELQNFAGMYGPAWSQGIGVIDAAQVLAGQPTEGVAHEMQHIAEVRGA